MIDIATGERIASHLHLARTKLETLRGMPVEEVASPLTDARHNIEEAVALIGDEPRWNGVRDAIAGEREWLNEVSSDGARAKSTFEGHTKQLFEHQHRVEGLMLNIDTKEEALSRALAIFERDPDTWSAKDITEVRGIFYRLPEEIRPSYPPSISGQSTTRTSQLDVQLNRLTDEYSRPIAIEVLRRYGDVIRLSNDPTATVEVLRARTLELLATGMRTGWKDDAVRSELRLLLCDMSPRKVGVGRSIFNGELRTQFLVASRSEQNRVQLDRMARTWTLLLHPESSMERSKALLRPLIERDPATWTNEEILLIESLLELPLGHHPLAEHQTGRNPLGRLHGMSGAEPHGDFSKVIALAAMGIDGITESLRRHTEALRIGMHPEVSVEANRTRVHHLLERPIESLSAPELRELRALLLDIPADIRPGGPSRMDGTTDLRELLTNVEDLGSLDAQQRHHLNRYVATWKQAFADHANHDAPLQQFDAVVAKPIASWSSDDATHVAAVVSWNRPADDFIGPVKAASDLWQRAETGVITRLAQTFSDLHLARRDPQHVERLAQRIDQGEDLSQVIGTFHGGDAVELDGMSTELFDRILAAPHPWSLQGARHLSELLSSKHVSDSTRTQIASVIEESIRVNDPELTSMVNRQHSTRMLSKNEGYANYEDFAENGELLALLDMSLARREVT